MRNIFLRYGIAVSENHVDSVWPFISNTGTFAPESCVFGLFLNTGALLGESNPHAYYCNAWCIAPFLAVNAKCAIFRFCTRVAQGQRFLHKNAL